VENILHQSRATEIVGEGGRMKEVVVDLDISATKPGREE
jgi:hypothetical protein